MDTLIQVFLLIALLILIFALLKVIMVLFGK